MQIKRHALIARPPERLFALVNDLERYPDMYPWCGEDWVAARLHVRSGGIDFSFATRNTLEPPHRMRMTMIEGPLRRLDGAWTFTPYGENGCQVDLQLDFEPKSRLFGLATSFAFQKLADRLVEDFSAKAASLDA